MRVCSSRQTKTAVRLLLGTALVLILSTLELSAQEQRYRSLYSTTNESGRTLVFSVLETRLLRTKKWSPDTDAPPLTIRDAIAAARKYKKPNKPLDLTVVRIELSASGGGEWRWFYIVELYDRNDAMNASPPNVEEVVVLMDGTIVTPSIEKAG